MDEVRFGESEERTDGSNDREAWLRFYDRQVESKQGAIGRFDSAVLAVSGAFLTLSVSFLRAGGQAQKTLLLVGWTLLALAVGCSVVSHLVAWFAGTRVVEQVAQICRGDCDPSQVDFSRGRKSTIVLNVASCVFLMTGVFVLVAFAYASM